MGGCAIPNAPTVAAAVNDPDLARSQDSLCRCLNAIDQSWASGLAALFENASDTEIASQLSDMVQCCMSGDAYSRPFPGAIPSCMVAPAYKGVSF